MAKIVYGQPVADELFNDLQSKVSYLNRFDKEARFIQVGENAGSDIYVRNKLKFCAKLGLSPILTKFTSNTNYNDLCDFLANSNSPTMLQFPVELNGISSYNQFDFLDYIKSDIDGLSFKNGAYLYDMNFTKGIVPCTAKAVMDILSFYDYDLSGKVVLIAGKSRLVGKPLIMLMLDSGATVLSINSKTPKKKVKELLKTADVLVSAIGVPKYFDSTLVPDTLEFIVDVGINKTSDGKIVGDIDPKLYDELPDSTLITPVPKGVGVVTVANVAYNILKLRGAL